MRLEACRAGSDAEFISNVETCSQEADEALLWLGLLRDDCAIHGAQRDGLLSEANQLLAIMTTIVLNVKRCQR